MPKLTAHQQRILAALLELERVHGRRWWGRSAIGCVIHAGGYHTVIQRRTMLALSAVSLVFLEVESWPADTRRLVSCNCAAYRWGLTDAGRAIAETLAVRWPADSAERIRLARWHECSHEDSSEGRTMRGDRFAAAMKAHFDEQEDDDDPADF
jgi:hypothetical protein